MVFLFYVQKGGAGKTTLSGTVAYLLAKEARTIILDCDPQGNLSSWLLKEAPTYELADLLNKKVSIQDSVITVCENLDIIPTFGDGGELGNYSEHKVFNEPFVFCDLVEELQNQGYKYIVFDTSPRMGQLEKSLIMSSDYIITPVNPDSFGLDSLQIFNTFCSETKKSWKRGGLHKHIIINEHNKQVTISNTIVNQIKDLQNYEVFTIPVDQAFKKAQSLNCSIEALQRTDKAKKETIETLESIIKSLISMS